MLKSENPATKEIIWEGENCSAEEVARKISHARAAFPAWARRPFEERLAIVERFTAIAKERQDEMATAIAMETGKTLWDARTEAAALAAKAAISLQAYHERTGEKTVTMKNGIQATLRHKPHGVMAVFGPYNFPAHLPNGHIIPALLAGNVIIFKPSELTPMVGEKMVGWWEEAGLPPHILSLTQGERETGIALASHPDIDGLLFTGSSPTGEMLHKQYGGQPQKVMALEMGGNNPLVVWEPEDMKAAAYHTILSAFISTGQRCTCARRLILPDSQESNAFLDELVLMASNLTVGSYQDRPEPFMGPLIRNEEAERIIAAQTSMEQQGGKPLLPMKKELPYLPFVTPGIMDVTAIESRGDDEYFAPFLQVIRVKNFDAAIAEANQTAYGLAAAIFTADAERYARFRLESRAGLINWNRQTTGASGALPFGGTGISGNHRPAGYYAADYCAYPVASLESESLTLPESLSPGMKLE